MEKTNAETLVRLTVRLPLPLNSRAHRYARKTRTPVAATVRKAIAAHLDREEMTAVEVGGFWSQAMFAYRNPGYLDGKDLSPADTLTIARHVAGVAAVYADAAMGGLDGEMEARSEWDALWTYDEDQHPELSRAAWEHAIEIGAMLATRARDRAA